MTMKIYGSTSWILVLGVVALLAASCGSEDAEGTCRDNAGCADGFYCGPDHYCLCERDDACADDEYCNAEGYCQKFQGCRVDADCNENERCQIETTGKGTCLCMNDQACPDGQFCNASGMCQDKVGCFVDADCGNEAQWFCRINATTGIGECFCKSNDACEQGEFCNPNGYCQPVAACQGNDDCPAGTLCDIPSGECLCDPEAQTGCKSDEVCNSSGYCQPRPGCYDNSDCEDLPGTFCDITTRTCIPEGTCTSHRQCPLAYVCQGGVCVEGCNFSSDCYLDQCCISNQCQSCDCQDDAFCGFAEFCNSGSCSLAYTPTTPYCKPCTNGLNQCGDVMNSCLIYPYLDDDFAQHSDEYCSVDCSANERCPQGFQCNSVILVEGVCHSDNDCPGSIPCWKSPEEDEGYCPCHPTSNPCPTDFCIGGTCFYQNTPCGSAADCIIECESDRPDQLGGCTVGKNCGLEEGVHCPDPDVWP
jgi:hypothetical protein